MVELAITAITVLLPQGDKTLVRDTRHFRLVCNVPSARAADEASKAIELAWKHSARFFSLARIKPSKRLTVTLHPDAAAYEAIERTLTRGLFKRNHAFAHEGSRSAHVALQPPIETSVVDNHGLPMRTIQMLADSTARLLFVSALRNSLKIPRWIADGAPSVVSYEVLKELGLVSAPDRDPVLGQAMHSVQSLIRDDRLPNLEQLLSDGNLGLEFFPRFNYSWLFVRHLMLGEERRGLLRVTKNLGRLGRGSNVAAKLRRNLIKQIGKSRFKSLDERFRSAVTQGRPPWAEVVRSLETRGSAWRQMAFPGHDAVAWRTSPSGKRTYSIRGGLQILPGGAHRLSVLLDRQDTGYVSVAFAVGVGVSVSRYDASTEQWTPVLRAPIESLKLSQTMPFSITVTGSKVAIEVAGKPIGKVDLESEPLVGPWGLSAEKGCAGVWLNLSAPGLAKTVVVPKTAK